MNKVIYDYKYALIGLVVSIIGFTVFHSFGIDIKEKTHIYINHLERYEINEIFAFWIKIFIVFALINYLVNIEKRRNKAKKKIYRSMLYACNHILKNFLYQSQVLQIEAELHPEFDKRMVKMYIEARDEAEILIRKLSDIDNVEDKDIYEAIKAEAKGQDR